MIAVFLTLLLITAVADAQTTERTRARRAASEAKAATDKPKRSEAFPLREIRIVGNENFPSEEIIAVTQLKIGDMVRPHDFESAGRKLERTVGLRSHWTRPGKESGTSATTIEDGPLFVFSTNAAPLPPNQGISKFFAYALLNHGDPV